ncbi:filamentous hemagglutinin N-terminal domain-containing protein [Nostoc sp. C110]|uniref:two-partner secretion domain-containing protein n=1 Tax=Nostoc sp. C110 TaxID=3349876 RepID=UPI00370DAF16
MAEDKIKYIIPTFISIHETKTIPLVSNSLMKIKMQKIKLYLFVNITLHCLLSTQAIAEIVPDTSLPSNSQVINQDNIHTINGGTRTGNNLFHSFEKFSVTTGDTAYFNNATDIQHIFSRVTGSSISNIDGILKANGTADLFLINPNGIIFGTNASLNVGGSFIGSTADSITFADKFKFSATNAQITPILTISLPIGLQLGKSPGSIIVQGTGHNFNNTLLSPVLESSSNSNGLRVFQGKTLALIGSNVNLSGGILTAPGGNIELGSVETGEVNLNSTSTGWIFDYKNVQNFLNITFSQQALIDASGTNGGSSIHLVGKQISLTDGSVALIQNQGSETGATINVNAFDSLELSGVSSDKKSISGLFNETVAGNAGNVEVTAKNLVIQDGAAISVKTFTQANGGNIILNISESAKIVGFSSIDPTITSGIGNYTFSSGKGGEIIINAGQLTSSSGGTIISGTFGAGKGGNLTINADQSVQLSGFNPFVPLASTQLAVGAFSTGNAGTLTVNTTKVLLQNGSNINSYTLGKGNAGSVIVNASNSIDITRENSNGLLYNQPFGISSTAAFTSNEIQQLLGLPTVTDGDAGDIIINTNRLSLKENTLINVSSFGTSNAGNLIISANNINLDNSNIAAASILGQGGNIFLSSSLLQLRSSKISTTAGIQGGSSNGGNIRIDTDILAATDNSAITANAYQGRGGNIRIDAKGSFTSPDTQITASSKLGIDGTVQINFQNGNLNQTKAQPEYLAQQPQIVSVCQGHSGNGVSTFVNSGTGGGDSKEQFYSSGGWQENSIPMSADNLDQTNSLVNKEPTSIVEAQGWIKNANGEVVLTAQANPTTANNSLSTPSCSATVQK